MPGAEPDALQAIVRDWHQRALPFIRTKIFDESWTDFVTAWQRVERPAGRSLQVAAEKAQQEPPPPVADRYDGPLRGLVALCWQLQTQWGDRPFPLACRTAADVLGVSAIKAWRLLNTLQFDGILRLVKTGTKTSKKASEWRFKKEEMSMAAAKKLNRTTFLTSREMDFFSEKELVTQTGHEIGDWPLVIPKELTDNALDACEDADIRR